MNTALEMVW